MSYSSCGRSVRVAVGLIGLLASLACDSTPKAAENSVPPTTKDSRTPVALPADGQQAVLREMRQMLGAVGGALSAVEALLPATWKELAERTHGGFDSLTAAVRRARTGLALKDTVLVGIARISGSCTACHETFRITLR
jgi:hypothetical protein